MHVDSQMGQQLADRGSLGQFDDRLPPGLWWKVLPQTGEQSHFYSHGSIQPQLFSDLTAPKHYTSKGSTKQKQGTDTRAGSLCLP
jgi:hypothetical protein